MYIITDETVTTGDRWFVDSGSAVAADSVGAGTSPDSPFLTWDYAVGIATANNGDTIYLMPGHAETITAAGGVTLDKAGIRTIGIGEGSDRPTFTFTTANGASILITAASNVVKNIIAVGNKDGLTSPFHIQAADCELDIEYRDTSSLIEAVTAVLTTAAASRLKLKIKYLGFTAGDACVRAIRLVGVTRGYVDIDYYGSASIAVIGFTDTASIDVKIVGNFYNNDTVLTKNVVDTIGGSTWTVNGFEGKGGYPVSGGSSSTPAADDLSAIATQANKIDAATLAVSPTANSLAAFIASGGTALGTELADSKSIVDAIGHTGTAFHTTGVGYWTEKTISASADEITEDLFLVAGGPIQITSLVGYVNVLIGANITTAKVILDATLGAGYDLEFSTAVAITDDAVGTIYIFSDANPAVLTPLTPGAASGGTQLMKGGWFCPAGMIEQTMSADPGGAVGDHITWYMTYRPLIAGVTVTAQ